MKFPVFLVIRAKIIGQKIISPSDSLHGEKMIEYKIKLIKVSCPCPSEFMGKENYIFCIDSKVIPEPTLGQRAQGEIMHHVICKTNEKSYFCWSH